MGGVVQATVGAELVLHDVHPKAARKVVRELSLVNPKWVTALRMNKHYEKLEERIEAAVEMPDGSVVCPRGAVGQVKAALAEIGFTLSVSIDRRAAGMPLPAHHDVPLRDYQREALDTIRLKTQGLVVLPCGTGKTRVGLATVGAIGRRALITVPSLEIAEQWIEGAGELLGLRATLVGAGKNETDGDIVVGIEDALVERIKTWEPTHIASFGIAIFDEAHGVPAVTVQSIARHLPARWRFGLTATPEREDGLTAQIHWTLGPLLYMRTTAEMIARGVLSAGEIEFVESPFRFAKEDNETTEQAIARMELELSEDMARNAIIVDGVARDAKEGHTTLVLVGRKEMARDLSDWLQRRGVKAIGVTSASAKKARAAAIAAFRDGTLPVLIATSLADQGLDVPRLSRVWLATPMKAKGKTTQRVGRMLRQWAGKMPKLYDVVDPKVDTLVRREKERRRVYRELGLLT